MNTSPIITVSDLRMGFAETLLLKNVSFEVNTGEIFIILGGSGCGKSTLLKHLLGLYTPQAGTIRIGSIRLDPSDKAGYESILSRIGVTYQGGALFGSMTLAENIALPLTSYTSLPDSAVADLVRIKLGLVGLSGFENHLPEEISGGMKKRAAIARAMALNPDILFLDEPSAGLDPITAAELDQLILRLNRALGTTMVIVSHELPSINTIAHRVIMLDRESKGIIANGPPQDMPDHPHPFVRSFFTRTTVPEKPASDGPPAYPEQ
jgi:phospholipid/cholesterol/gamma-HCH transport system ATP-binding protein